MASKESSPERRQAHQRFEQAQHELSRGHAQRAVELAREALEFDESYQEVRLWLAELHLTQDEAHHASHLLQDVLRVDRDHQQAWTRLREIDPAAAARLDRLSHLAPDPFVSGRRAEAFSDEFEDLETLGEEAQPAVSEFYHPEEAGEPWIAAPPEPEWVEEAPPQGEQRGPAPWEYEQDREYFLKWQQRIVMRMAHALRELWTDYEAMRPVMDLGAHLDKRRHAEIAEAVGDCCGLLGVEDAVMMIFPERCMHPVPLQDHPPSVAIPTALMRAMQGAEMTFQVGRELAYVRSGYLAEWQVGHLIAARPTRLVGDVATNLRELWHECCARFEAEISAEERPRMMKLAHAWQQRATLSADRAGLLCCGDVEVACRAIAKTTAASVEAAARLTLSGFLEQFKGQDPGALAAIPVTETPDRSVPYTAYRIMMLRWWAKSGQCAELRASLGG